MLVKDVVVQVLNILQNYEMVETLNSGLELNETQTEELGLLVMCVNLVNNIIATDYIKLKETVSLHNTNGKIRYADITNRNILDIVSISDDYGNSLRFKSDYDGVITKKGKVKICYAFIPNSLNLDDEIDYKTHMTERVFSYGVLAEYFFVKGNFDDASIWDIRFKQALQSVRRSLKDVRVLKREWI